MYEVCSVYYVDTRLFCFFKQKTAYEMRISDWSSDVCSSDLPGFDLKPLTTPDLISIAAGAIALAAFLVAFWFNRGARADGARIEKSNEIGRASCRERVCQYV